MREFKQGNGKMLADAFGTMGSATLFCPATSNVNLFRYGKRIVDLDTEISHGALDLGMAKRMGFIIRISYVIESQRPAVRRLMLPATRAYFCQRRPHRLP